MRNWLPWLVGAVAVAAVVYVFSTYANNRLGPDDKPEQGPLIGKQAPNFEGDFAVNGNPVKLSDLKGKVVLVDFWAVWCGPCIATFPHLREWSSRYKQSGLEIVGLTMYNYETGRFFGFDKERGKLTKPASADKSSEQAMLKDFAKHHGLDYLLMAQPGAEMSKTANDYEIEGYPTMILIDRKGVIRMVRSGATEGNAIAIERAIKRLLAES